MSKIKVLSIFGTRPCAIKMAPVIHEMEENENIESFVAVTDQHKEMLEQVLELFNIKVNYHLNIMQREQTLTYITTSILEKIDKVFDEVRPDIVLVQGDTLTAFVAALASFYRKVIVGHIEAGLRTHVKYNPFPEEMNRRLVDQLSDLHFAPTTLSKDNLLKEGFSSETIIVTGNTVIDALLNISAKSLPFQDKSLVGVDFSNKRVVLLTSHRRENWGETMEGIFEAMVEITQNFNDVEVVFPVHLNPKVQNAAEKILSGNSKIHLLPPLSYQDLVSVMKKSYLVMTDSGGIQEEAPSLGKPVLVLRSTTERPEGIEAGTLKLAGVDKKTIVEEAAELLNNDEMYKKMSKATNPYGDGKASKRIVQQILYRYSLSKQKPEEFNQVN